MQQLWRAGSGGNAGVRAGGQVNGMLLEGKKVFVGPFLKRAERPNDGEVRFTNVFVKNLADSVTEHMLQELFGKHGKVTSVAVMKVRPRLPCPLQGADDLISLLPRHVYDCKSAAGLLLESGASEGL